MSLEKEHLFKLSHGSPILERVLDFFFFFAQIMDKTVNKTSLNQNLSKPQ